MTLSQLQDYTFTTKYARYNADLKRRETFEESVDRVMAMHAKKYEGKDIKTELEFVTQAMKEKLVLGSQRALQFGGSPILNKNARIYNCTVSYIDRVRFFQEALWLLLCGCGVGFSVQKHHIAKLPEIKRVSGDVVVYQIPDSIEGWADALGVLVSSYFIDDQPFPEYFGKKVEFDYSLIRPKGAKLASGCGKAPGSDPLRRSLEKIRTVIEARLASAGDNSKLRPIDAYDIVMHASDAVLAGGVRRSATICVFSPDDVEMATAKTGMWFVDNPQRGRSNNSAMLLRSETSFSDFASLMKSVKEFGEPGFVWSDSTEVLYNPCVEIGMYPVDVETGKSGWSFCNLCEINMKLCTTPAVFERACRAAAILGSFQAGYDKFPYLGETTERIVKKEALLGCSMTGMMDTPSIAFDAELQREMAKLIVSVNTEVASKLGINPAARTTCVKPAGSTSCILGTASGIHPHHAKRYFRRVQANTTEAPLQYFKAHNPRAVEKSVWNPNGTDEVVSFCVEIPEDAVIKNELNAVDLLERVKLTQQNWVSAGKVESRCTAPWLSHNVSNTITVRDNEWDDVTNFIYNNRAHFAGISLLGDGGDMDYPQAPFCAVWTYDEIISEYGAGALFASGLIVDGLHAFNNDLWKACSVVLGQAPEPTMPLFNAVNRIDEVKYRASVDTVLMQKDWIRRAKKFAENYFNNDLKRMTYCLKRISNYKLWLDLKREYVNVDYTLMFEESDDTKLVEALACSGGRCEV
jgi:ribonucleoside-diphosphate reductase alpha chain